MSLTVKYLKKDVSPSPASVVYPLKGKNQPVYRYFLHNIISSFAFILCFVYFCMVKCFFQRSFPTQKIHHPTDSSGFPSQAVVYSLYFPLYQTHHFKTMVVESDLHEKVVAALETIRPYLVADGGDLRVLEITEDKVVKVELLGNCGSCPMSTMTMKAGIEQAVMSAVPEIKGVFATNATPPEIHC